MNKHKKNKTSGITILSLVVTVIVLLILAGISMMMLSGDNGIILNAGKAKESVSLAQEADKIERAALNTSAETKYGDIIIEVLQDKLDKEFGENQAEAIDNGDTVVVKIEERYYEIDQEGNLSEPITLEKIEYAGDITKGGACTGTQNNPYRIECIEDLVALSTRAANKMTNKDNLFYVLTKDLDFKSIFSYANYKSKYKYDNETDSYIPDESSETTIKELCTTGQGFIPIGLNYGNNIVFQGTFDGKYNDKAHKISNIYINRESTAALFGAGKHAKIKNLTIDGHIISTNSVAAGIMGTAFSITITKCYNKAQIEGKTGARGIFNTGSATITECGNEGKIISQSGISTGIANGGTISKCYNKGNISSGGTASGIVGYGDYVGKVTNCYNYGDIVAGSKACTAGGISAWFSR